MGGAGRLWRLTGQGHAGQGGRRRAATGGLVQVRGVLEGPTWGQSKKGGRAASVMWSLTDFSDQKWMREKQCVCTMRRNHPLASWWWTLIGWAEEVVAGMCRWRAGGLNTQPERKRNTTINMILSSALTQSHYVCVHLCSWWVRWLGWFSPCPKERACKKQVFIHFIYILYTLHINTHYMY